MLTRKWIRKRQILNFHSIFMCSSDIISDARLDDMTDITDDDDELWTLSSCPSLFYSCFSSIYFLWYLNCFIYLNFYLNNNEFQFNFIIFYIKWVRAIKEKKKKAFFQEPECEVNKVYLLCLAIWVFQFKSVFHQLCLLRCDSFSIVLAPSPKPGNVVNDGYL